MIYEQGSKAVINSVGRSVQEYIAFSLFRIDLPSVGQYEKSRGQYIPALISHSVNSFEQIYEIATVSLFHKFDVTDSRLKENTTR